MFSLFERDGLDNRDLERRYRQHILEPGGRRAGRPFASFSQSPGEYGWILPRAWHGVAGLEFLEFLGNRAIGE